MVTRGKLIQWLKDNGFEEVGIGKSGGHRQFVLRGVKIAVQDHGDMKAFVSPKQISHMARNLSRLGFNPSAVKKNLR